MVANCKADFIRNIESFELSKEKSPSESGVLKVLNEHYNWENINQVMIQNEKILLFNFYNGVLYRGIPIYSSNLKIGLEKEGCEVNEWKCPNALNKMPRFLLDLLFVFSEQILMPLICFWTL